MPTHMWSSKSCTCSRDSSPWSGRWPISSARSHPLQEKRQWDRQLSMSPSLLRCWSNGAHPSWCPRKAQGGGLGRALAHDAFCDPAQRRDRTHLQQGMGFAGAHCSGPQGINFCCGLRCPYDCSTFLFTLNCLEIKTKDKIKRKNHLAFAHWALLSCRATEATSISEKEKHRLAHCSW